MSRTAQIIWQAVGIAVALLILAGAVAWGYSMRPSKEVCPSLTYRLLDGDLRQYVTDIELDSLLRKAEVYPVGKHIDRVAIDRIEETMRQHPMVERAECYTTPLYEVKVDIRQRQPILKVQTPTEVYFIDTHHRMMPWREQVRDEVLLVTGAVGLQAARTSLADIAEWMQKEPYWSERIERIHMRTPQMVVVYLKGENMPTVVMGNLSGYRHKLGKLRTFLEKGAEATQDQHYRELDIRFRGQVIGRK